MRIATVVFFLAAGITAAILFASRQRALNELRAANLSLQQQLDAVTATPQSAPAAPVPPTNQVADLSAQEQSELLRLRGQIQPLRRELAALSNRLSTAAPSKPPVASGPAPAQQARFQAMQAFTREHTPTARNLAAAIAKYVVQNGGRLPDDLAKLEGAAPSGLPAEDIQKFELMRSGQLSDEEKAYVFVAREKEPGQLPDGRWGRAYVCADGAIVVGLPDDPSDWAGWERSAEESAKRHPRTR